VEAEQTKEMLFSFLAPDRVALFDGAKTTVRSGGSYPPAKKTSQTFANLHADSQLA
jgi:hypothetical protein